MPRIYYTAEGYNGPYLDINTNQEQHILCRKLDLYRSIITVGNPSFFSWKDVRINGFFRTLSNSVIQKILLVQANIESNQNGMYLHPVFNTYVSDQKRIVSYNLGMAVAKLYAEKLLNIPNLIHVESLKKVNAITFVNQVDKSKEPDLVGQTSNGEWHVFEAKGTSSKYLTTKISEAKEQARQIQTIHGANPSTISACATSFGADKIFTKIVDPPNEKGKEIEIDISKFFDNYYSPFFAMREASNSSFKTNKFENIEFNSIDIHTNTLNLTIGIETEVYELIQEKNFSLLKDYYSKKGNVNENFTQENQISIGLDGFIVKYSNH
ncbi:hypothetical protein [Sphingobacterium faecium]|uniref:hypothetical protein n=1 Tax=Sphingobacterium faecium TaxID=34087 RepID=UPI0024790A4A|nr:hypothetical protein [Sphingobacterium faecium]WGQ14522.1 hypothetical protein QG727_21175 [Sphingobacterium faecium]